jgi:hypothetical protein
MRYHDAGAMPGSARLVEFVAAGISADRARWAFHRAGLRGWSTPAGSQQPDGDTASIRAPRFFILRGHWMGWHPIKGRQAPRWVGPVRFGAGQLQARCGRADVREFVRARPEGRERVSTEIENNRRQKSGIRERSDAECRVRAVKAERRRQARCLNSRRYGFSSPRLPMSAPSD